MGTSMRTIGLIGGMSWESTAEYYRILNERTRERLGGLHSARCVLFSVDFALIEELQVRGRWAEAGEVLAGAARALEAAGADLLLICTNTMHKVADQVEAATSSRCCTSRTPRRPPSGPRGCGGWGCWARRSPWSRSSTGAASRRAGST